MLYILNINIFLFLLSIYGGSAVGEIKPTPVFHMEQIIQRQNLSTHRSINHCCAFQCLFLLFFKWKQFQELLRTFGFKCTFYKLYI